MPLAVHIAKRTRSCSCRVNAHCKQGHGWCHHHPPPFDVLDYLSFMPCYSSCHTWHYDLYWSSGNYWSADHVLLNCMVCTLHGESIGSANNSLRTFAWLQGAAVQLPPLISASLLSPRWDPPQLPGQFLQRPHCCIMPLPDLCMSRPREKTQGIYIYHLSQCGHFCQAYRQKASEMTRQLLPAQGQ